MKRALGDILPDSMGLGMCPSPSLEAGLGGGLEPMGGGKGFLNKGGCFTAGTLVQTDHGSVPIEKLRKGDRVYSRDPKTGKTELKQVLQTTVRRVNTVVRLQMADSRTGKTEQVTATVEHPFWVKGKGFVQASELGIGTQIVTRAGPTLVVKSTRQLHPTGGYVVYNAVIEADHTYFVGELDGGAWVHNPAGCPGDFADAARRTDHFIRHGSDFGASTEDQYVAQANHFLRTDLDPNTLSLTRATGDVVKYNPVTEEFGVLAPNGTIRTYYRPNPAKHPFPTNLDYFNAQ